MKPSDQTIGNIYFTSWQYVRIGAAGGKMSSGGSGVSWVGADGRILRPGCDAIFSGEDDCYLSSTKYLDSEIRYVSYCPRGIRLVAQKPTRVKFTDPLGMDREASPVPANIVFDQGKYKCWYSFLPEKKPTTEPFHHFNQHICYAESTDGFNWTKPNLGLFEHEGSRDNNIVLTPYEPYARNVHCPGVFVDDYGDPNERYKMAYWGSFSEEHCTKYRKEHPEHFETWKFGTGKGAWGLAGATSPDGIHWTLRDEPLMVHFTDMIWASLSYDPRRQHYICYHRSYATNPASPEGFGAISRRSVARSTSTDFRYFGDTDLLLSTGADVCPSHVFYQPSQTWLPGCAGDQQVMFVCRWKQENDVEDICLYSTLDGWTWSAVPDGSPILEAGKPGTWEGSYVVTGGYIIELPGDRWALPYQGFPIPHKYPRIDPDKRTLHTGVEAGRGYAVWPAGRLVAMECPEVGEFETVAVNPAGDTLTINAEVDPAGYIKVGVKLIGGQDVPGRTVEDCDMIWGNDGLQIPVTWKGQANLNAGGQPVVLSFKLCRTKLFGLSFR